MQKILVSRCLLGHRVRYDGGAHGPFDQLQRWLDEGRVVALCPEVAGGLPTPRPPAEIRGGQGGAVLDGRQPVLTIDGEDVTAAFVDGAELVMRVMPMPAPIQICRRFWSSNGIGKAQTIFANSS